MRISRQMQESDGIAIGNGASERNTFNREPNLQPLVKDIVKIKAKKEIEKVISKKIKGAIGSDAEKALKKLFNF